MPQADESRPIGSPTVRCLIPFDLDTGSNINGQHDVLAYSSQSHDPDQDTLFWEELTETDGTPEPLTLELGDVTCRVEGGWRLFKQHGKFIWVVLQLWANAGGQRVWPCSLDDPAHNFEDHQAMFSGVAHGPCPPRPVHRQLLDTPDACFSFAAAMAGRRDYGLPVLIPPGLDDKNWQTQVRPLVNGSVLAYARLFRPHEIEGTMGWGFKPIGAPCGVITSTTIQPSRDALWVRESGAA